VLAFAVAPEDRNQSDSFLQASAGASLHQQLDPAWSLLADIALNSRGYGEVDRFSYGSADLGLGTSYTAGPHNVVLKALGQKYRLDDQAFRALWGGMAQYQYLASQSRQFSAYVQGTRLAYETQGARDADRYTLGLAWTQALEMNHQPVVYAGLYAGQETPLDEKDVEHLGYDFYGLRGGGAVFLSRTLQLNASLSVEKRKNNAVYPVALPALVTRSDTQYDASLGLTYIVAPQISIRPAYSYSDSNSNLIINDYQRNVVSIDFRYEL
jgi:outer membrane protein